MLKQKHKKIVFKFYYIREILQPFPPCKLQTTSPSSTTGYSWSRDFIQPIGSLQFWVVRWKV